MQQTSVSGARSPSAAGKSARMMQLEAVKSRFFLVEVNERSRRPYTADIIHGFATWRHPRMEYLTLFRPAGTGKQGSVLTRRRQ